MKKFIFSLLIFLTFILIFQATPVSAVCTQEGQPCTGFDVIGDFICIENKCTKATSIPTPTPTPSEVQKVFGKIELPEPIRNLGSGSVGISNVISRIIEIIYIFAGIIFVFMIIISAVQWILSGGDKEGLSKAKERLTSAIIGIVLLSVSFVIIKLIGQITGFTFFSGQNITSPQDSKTPSLPYLGAYEICEDRGNVLGYCPGGFICQPESTKSSTVIKKCLPY